jgi:DNA-binding PadR family transcriptional regulator
MEEPDVMDKFSSELMRGSLDLMVLSILADGPKYGYLIQQRLREASRDMARLQAGTLYPLLHRLEADKLIKSRWDDSTGRRRKWYELSAAGRARLKQQAKQWQEYAECLRALLAPVLDPPAQPA